MRGSWYEERGECGACLEAGESLLNRPMGEVFRAETRLTLIVGEIKFEYAMMQVAGMLRGRTGHAGYANGLRCSWCNCLISTVDFRIARDASRPSLVVCAKCIARDWLAIEKDCLNRVIR